MASTNTTVVPTRDGGHLSPNYAVPSPPSYPMVKGSSATNNAATGQDDDDDNVEIERKSNNKNNDDDRGGGGGDYHQRQYERMRQYNYHRYYGGGDSTAPYSPAPPPRSREKLSDSYKTVLQRPINKHPVDRYYEYERKAETKKQKQKLDNEQRLRDYATAMRIHNESQQASTRLRRGTKYIEEEAVVEDLRRKLGLIVPSPRPSTIQNTPALLALAPSSMRSTFTSETRSAILAEVGDNDGDGSGDVRRIEDGMSPVRPNTAPSTVTLPTMTQRQQQQQLASTTTRATTSTLSSSTTGREGRPPLRLSREVQQRLMTPKHSPRDAGRGGVGRLGYTPYVEEEVSTTTPVNGQSASDFEDFAIYHKGGEEGGARGSVSLDTERRNFGPVHHSVRSFKELLPGDFQPTTTETTTSTQQQERSQQHGTRQQEGLDQAALQLDWGGSSQQTPLHQQQYTSSAAGSSGSQTPLSQTVKSQQSDRPSTRGKIVTRRQVSPPHQPKPTNITSHCYGGSSAQSGGKTSLASTAGGSRGASGSAGNKTTRKKSVPPIPPPISPRDLPMPKYALCTPGGIRSGGGIGGLYNGEGPAVSPSSSSTLTKSQLQQQQRRPNTSPSARLSNPSLRREHEDAVKARLEYLVQQNEERRREKAQLDERTSIRIEEVRWRRKNPLRAQAMDRLLQGGGGGVPQQQQL